jgi:2,3-bisphosphoglycerate-dependent phosphoglycerate mutase
VRLDAQGERVLLVAHQVVVLLTRYVLEGMDEQGVLALDAEGDVLNCGVTRFAYDEGAKRLRLVSWNEATPLEDEDAPVTAEPDAPGAPR